MKRFLAISVLVLSAFLSAAQPDTPVVQYLRENPRRAAFNTHSYEFLPLHDTPAPKGYKPFYISHYGRHGSRSEWGGSQYALVRDILARAGEAGLLTPAGDSLMHEAAVIYELYNGMDGRLTPRGVREHAALAERMYHRYPEVFRDGSKHIRAVSSTTPRVIVSMNGFTARLTALQPDLDIDLDTGEKYMAYIAQGENGTISSRTERVMAGHRKTMRLDTVAVLRNLFKDPEAGKAFVPDVIAFQGAIYSVAKVAEAFDIDDNLFRYLPFGNVVQFHEMNFLSAYLNQCNSELNGALRLPLNKPLVDILVRQADEVIAGTRRNAADLTFGHDWPFLGLVCYLGLEGVSEKLSVEEAAANWLPAYYCPFATNLQMIFYRSRKSDRVLVKFLHNERESHIPAIQAVQGPYYDWNDVKAYLARRVPSAQIVAHRGIWKGNAQNSIASLREAQQFGCWGSEFDLHLTADDEVVVNHDPTIDGLDIQKSTLAEVRTKKLANGETVPTLAEYMAQAVRNRDCLPVLELKPHASAEREDVLVEHCLKALRPAPSNIPPQYARRLEPAKVAFISFSHHICRELARKAPGYTVQYLGGDIAPSVLHAEGINGIDYHYSVFYKHPEWVKEAHDLGMSVNVWTVDDRKDIEAMRDLGVDQITTNDPALVRTVLWEACR
ncbi:MAG: histidine-type phosphatase [Bacteroidales bacterium]|nr:histidine-type phosphatase [Bacteroidales bacterium]